MTRRIILLVGAAILFALFIGLIWFWFFRGSGTENLPPGQFGSGQERPGSGNSSAPPTNIPSGVQNAGGGHTSSQVIDIRSGGNATSTLGGVGGVSAVPGVDWLGGSSLGGPTTNFTPSGINELNDGSVGGSPGILGKFPGSQVDDGSNLGFAVGGILGAAAGCALYFAFKGQGTAETAAKDLPVALGGGYVLVYDFSLNAKSATKEWKDVGDCLTRTIARTILQQMTNSIVNWINSGFKGSPSFVTNFEQFFTNVGDQAAGEFIRGTPLAFLCSPFQLQIRIAVAQSYARRGAASCSLTGIVKNIDSFMNGNFSAGGWGGLLQFTTVPTNNPYGAFAFAQIGLVTAQQNAVNGARNNLSPGGFIGLKKETHCDTTALPPPPSSSRSVTPIAGKDLYKVCDLATATPGSVIENAMNQTQNESIQSLQLAKNFDEIINALITQLMVKTLYSGFTTLSGSQGYAANYLTPEQQKAQADAQAILTDMQARLQVVQQYGSVQQGSIQDIQATQQRLAGLMNCWESKSKTAQASSTEAVIHSFDSLIEQYNQKITRANTAIAALQELQTQVLSVASAADVAAVTAAYNQALAGGTILSPADVTSAQQDRTTLQSSLRSRDQQTAAELETCYASL